MPNRLAASTSPYLQQHADNPVDWFEWGPEAFAEAARRDVPILLSVGYAACHWCHVMAHDSFEREDVAAVMNAGYVNVKVDREERPDVDAVYMQATTALTGSGGWPMTCLLTPDGTPFFAGTFFPRAQFLELLDGGARAWREHRDEVVAAGQRIVAALGEHETAESDRALAHPPLGAEQLDGALGRLVAQHDREHGGFGGAPKFPPSMVVEFLFRHAERTGDPTAAAIAEHTLDAMARGGIHDQLAGGFARYAVDGGWVVPHFEKMLYDNAQLLRDYVHWWRRSGDPSAERVARGIADFLLRDLVTPQGGFASALDADTDGVEGATYVWTPDQLREVLGDRAELAAQLFAVTPGGTFEHGASTLQLPRDPDDQAQLAEISALLLAARTTRPQPQRDDKVVTAWNGLAIGALAEAGVLLDRRYLDAATRCAGLIVERHLVAGRLRRTSRDGVVGTALGVAEDYGDLADGLLVLHQATGELRWLQVAGTLLDDARRLFLDERGGVHDTGSDAEQLVRRPRDPSDGATPSGASALAGALLSYSALTGDLDARAAAEAILAPLGELAGGQPRFAGWALAVATGLADGPVQVAIVGDADGELTRTAWRHRPAGAVVVGGVPDAAGVALLAGRPVLDGPTAYVCRGMVCDLPVTSAEALRTRLGG